MFSQEAQGYFITMLHKGSYTKKTPYLKSCDKALSSIMLEEWYSCSEDKTLLKVSSAS